MDALRQRLGTDYGGMFGRTDSGKTVETGATKTWEHTSGLGVHTRLTVSERGARTRIRLEQQVGSLSPPAEGVIYGLLSMLLLGPLAAALGATLFDGALALVTSIVLGLVLFAAASYATYRADVAWRAKKHRKLEDLADDLAQTLAAPAASGDAASVSTPELARASAPEAGPLLDLDALDVLHSSRRTRPSPEAHAVLIDTGTRARLRPRARTELSPLALSLAPEAACLLPVMPG